MEWWHYWLIGLALIGSLLWFGRKDRHPAPPMDEDEFIDLWGNGK